MTSTATNETSKQSTTDEHDMMDSCSIDTNTHQGYQQQQQMNYARRKRSIAQPQLIETHDDECIELKRQRLIHFSDIEGLCRFSKYNKIISLWFFIGVFVCLRCKIKTKKIA